LLFHPRSAEFGLKLDHSPRKQLERRYIHRKGTKWRSLGQAKARAHWTIISMTEKGIMEIMAKKRKEGFCLWNIEVLFADACQCPAEFVARNCNVSPLL
jgi:hypothetical protein